MSKSIIKIFDFLRPKDFDKLTVIILFPTPLVPEIEIISFLLCVFEIFLNFVIYFF